MLPGGAAQPEARQPAPRAGRRGPGPPGDAAWSRCSVESPTRDSVVTVTSPSAPGHGASVSDPGPGRSSVICDVQVPLVSKSSSAGVTAAAWQCRPRRAAASESRSRPPAGRLRSMSRSLIMLKPAAAGTNMVRVTVGPGSPGGSGPLVTGGRGPAPARAGSDSVTVTGVTVTVVGPAARLRTPLISSRTGRLHVTVCYCSSMHDLVKIKVCGLASISRANAALAAAAGH